MFGVQVSNSVLATQTFGRKILARLRAFLRLEHIVQLRFFCGTFFCLGPCAVPRYAAWKRLTSFTTPTFPPLEIFAAVSWLMWGLLFSANLGFLDANGRESKTNFYTVVFKSIAGTSRSNPAMRRWMAWRAIRVEERSWKKGLHVTRRHQLQKKCSLGRAHSGRIVGAYASMIFYGASALVPSSTSMLKGDLPAHAHFW